MTGRIRVPSSRALDNAANHTQSNPTNASSKNRTQDINKPKKRGRPFSKPQVVAPVVVKQVEEEEEVDNDDDDMMLNGDGSEEEEEEEEEQEPDSTLYCVCLGIDTGEQPMIQCENCSNWFHFTCIGLNDGLAAEIEAYCCDTCEEMGMGQTRKIADKKKKVQPIKSKKPVVHLPVVVAELSDSDVMSEDSFSGTDSDSDVDDVDTAMNDFENEKLAVDDEYFASESNSGKRGKKSESDGGEERKKRRRRKVHVDSEEDEEYVGDEEAGVKRKRGSRAQGSSNPRRRRQSSIIEDSPPPSKPKIRKANNTASTSNSTPNITSVPATDKTRAHCIKTLAALFVSIFSASNPDAAEVEEKSSSFAISVESVLFESLGEVEISSGIKAPRTKYTTKFRSLVYNLKSNASFRSRITSSELSPTQIANMTNEDLLTPELKAMAESVRAASLKHSVKEVIGVPTAKRTHKGEIEIENYAAGAAAEEERILAEKSAIEKERRQARERSNSLVSSGPSPIIPDSYAFGPSTDDASTSTSQSKGSPTSYSTTPRPRTSFPTNLSNLAEDVDFDFDSPQASTSKAIINTVIDSPQGSTTLSPSSQMLPPPPPTSAQPRSRNSFDMASVWGSVKSNEIETDTETEAVEDSVVEDEFDPFAIASKGGNDEEFEASLLRDENSPLPIAKPDTKALKSSLSSKSVSSSTKSTTATLPAPQSTPTIPLSELSPVWAGDLMVPDEGGFPAFGVQVGGRQFGTAVEVWKQILPKGLTMSGRIPTKVASKYLVECCFASSRELIVLALLPDITGPNTWCPNKPVAESCLAKHAHVVDFYKKKDRIGVVSPPENLKKVVKDIYIVPLRKGESLPEYIELLDTHNVPEGEARDRDMMLAVIVIQKGSLPTLGIHPPLPLPTLPAVAALTSVASARDVTPPRTMIPASLPPRPFSQLESLPYAPSTSSQAYPSYPAPSIIQPIVAQSSYSYSQPPPAPTPITFDASALQTILAANPNALSSLLSNPSLLQSVMNSNNTPPPLTLPPVTSSENLDELLAGLSRPSLPSERPSGAFIHPSRMGQLASVASQNESNIPVATSNAPYVHPSRMNLVAAAENSDSRDQGWNNYDDDSRRDGDSRRGGGGGSRGGNESGSGWGNRGGRGNNNRGGY